MSNSLTIILFNVLISLTNTYTHPDQDRTVKKQDYRLWLILAEPGQHVQMAACPSAVRLLLLTIWLKMQDTSLSIFPHFKSSISLSFFQLVFFFDNSDGFFLDFRLPRIHNLAECCHRCFQCFGCFGQNIQNCHVLFLLGKTSSKTDEIFLTDHPRMRLLFASKWQVFCFIEAISI